MGPASDAGYGSATVECVVLLMDVNGITRPCLDTGYSLISIRTSAQEVFEKQTLIFVSVISVQLLVCVCGADIKFSVSVLNNVGSAH